MRTTLPFSENLLAPTRFAGKLYLLIFIIALCFATQLQAHTKPGDKHKGSRSQKINIVSSPKKTNGSNFFAAPVFSYNSPQTYTALTAIAPLIPAASGVAAFGYSATPVIVDSHINRSANNVAIDSQGNAYYTISGEIFSVPANPGPANPIRYLSDYLGDIDPYGIAVDSAGNFYFSDLLDHKVKKVLSSDPYNAIVIGTGFIEPLGIAVDRQGNVYVADPGHNSVFEIPVGGGQNILLSNTFNQPSGVAVDLAGNIYVADTDNDMIKKIPANHNPPIVVQNINGPYAVAVDAKGNLFVASYNNNGAITEFPAGSSTPVYLGSGFDVPIGIAADTKGNILVCDDNNLKKIKPTGGYFINKMLPEGLNFNSSTGVISGTPTAASVATNYIVTAYNGATSSSAALTITVNPPPLPSISYSAPQVYTVSDAISPLAPVTSNVGAFGFGSPIFLAAKHVLQYLAVDPAGNIYATIPANILEKVPPGGGSSTDIPTPGVSQSYGIAIDAAGNIYLADNGDKTIKEIPFGGGATVTLASGFSSVQGLAVDVLGNLYVADSGTSSVKKIPAGGGVPVVIGSGFGYPLGVAVDASGNVFVADHLNNKVQKIPAGGGAPIDLAPYFLSPTGVAIDGDGNIFVTDQSNLNMIPAGATDAVVVSLAFKGLTGVAVDNKGNIFVNDLFNIYQLKPLGGYFVNPQLPQGLNIDPATGIISGIPAAGAAASNYTVTACNFAGVNSTAVNITVNPLSISYNGPQSYQAGVLITPLSPGAGPSPQSFNFNTATWLTLTQYIYHVAVDASGNIYATAGDSSIRRINASGLPSKAKIGVGSGIIHPYGIAIDKAGNIYVTDLADDKVKKLPVHGSLAVTLGSGFTSPRGIAVDDAGNVFLTDGNVVKKIPAGGSSVLTVASGFNSPIGVGVDGLGNVFVADYGNNAVKKIPAAGGTPVTMGGGFVFPTDVVVDATGNAFVTDYGNSAVKEIPAGTNNTVILGSGFAHPTGLALDRTGNVFVADYGSGKVKQIQPSGGYFLNTELPQGLNFDTTTGIISGTPTTATAAKNYIITAWYNSFSASATMNIGTFLPPPVTLAYSGPQTYLANNYITPLPPASNNVAPPNYASPVTLPAHHILTYLAVDAADNIYATLTGSILQKEHPGDVATTDVSTPGVTSSYGIAIDAAGNIYLADNGDKTVKKIPVGGGATVTLASGFGFLQGLAVDPAGNLYVVDDNSAKKIPAGGGATVVIGTGFNHPSGIAADAFGNVYVADVDNNAVKKITSAGGMITWNTGFQKPSGVAVDPSGNVFVTDFGGVKMVPAYSSTPVLISSAFKGADAIALDAAGNLFVIDIFEVKQLKPTGGYFINTALPAGLIIDKTTGIISGGPTVASPAKNYTVTAYNILGGVSATLNIKVDALSISYSNPVTYYAGTAITPLAPATSGVNPPGYQLYPVTLKTGFSQPFGIAVDPAGDVFVADRGNSTVSKMPAGGGPMVTIGSGFSLPSGIASDAKGNVYVADQGHNAIKKIPVGGGAILTLGTGFNGPLAVAVDSSGNVYVADNGHGLVKKIFNRGGSIVTLGSGFVHPYGVTVDAAGNVYVADGGTNTITKIPVGGGTQVTLASGLNQPFGITVDASGNVYFADAGNNAVKKIPFGGGSPIALGLGFSSPVGLTTDGAGNLYVADENSGAAKKIIPYGGYFINPALPAGLSFDGATGIISGTPTKTSPAKNYTVTGYNTFGGNSATTNITVTSNPNLSSLALSSGTLTPAFTAETTGYNASVVNSVSSITVTPATIDPAAAITVNGAAVTSGSASAGIPLSLGANAINIVVTAQDGITTKTYTITVTRLSANAFLSGLSTSSGTLTPVFATGTLNYNTTVGNAVTSVTVTPATTNLNAKVKVNGVPVLSGTASANIPLVIGANAIAVAVTSQDETTTKTYTITVTRVSTNAFLAGLALSSGTLTPVFITGTINYTAAVANAVSSITVTPTTTNANATVKVNGTTVLTGAASANLPLVAGPNTITTVVTAQDGTTKKTYTVVVTRAPSTVATLSNLTLSTGTLTPAFGSAHLNYTASVGNAATAITLTPAATDASAIIKVNGAIVVSGSPSASLPLSVGSNTITTIVTAQDGVTTKTYSVTVTRAKGNTGLADNISTTAAVAKPDDGIVVQQGVSPNGDGVNDMLTIEGINNYPDNKLTIMNRSGELVFETKGYNNSSRAFDGHSNKNGKKQQAGTYFYSLAYKVAGLEKHKTGFIILKY